MKVQTIQKNNDVSFKYSHPLKTLFKKGKIPLKYDFYGEPLTKKNVTIEHIQCVCNGENARTVQWETGGYLAEGQY